MRRSLIAYDPKGYRDIAFSAIVHALILLPIFIISIILSRQSDSNFIKQVTIMAGDFKANPYNIPNEQVKEAFREPQRIRPASDASKIRTSDLPITDSDVVLPSDKQNETRQTNITKTVTPTRNETDAETKQNLEDFLNATETADDLFGAPTATGNTTPGARGEIGAENQLGIDWGASAGRSVLQQARPVYPPALRAQGVKGSLTLRFEVTGDGTVRNPVVVRSSGYSEFDRSAIEALRKYRFNAIPSDAVSVGTITIVFDAQ